MTRKLILVLSLLFLSAVSVAAERTLFDVLKNDPRYSLFLDAVEQGDMTETLKSEGPFTLFAPTDDAIAKLPAGQWIAVMEGPKLMKALVKNHLANGELGLADLRKQTFVETLLGSHFALTINGDKTVLADAVLEPDEVTVENGVVHAIDRVLPTPYIE